MKFFLTVGTQAPFDRLIKIVDNWLLDHKNIEAFAQIGNGNYIPQNMKYKNDLTEEGFNDLFDEADLIISHAGMGTIINASQKQKPLIVLPRKKEYGEHRNDHQVNTVEGMSNSGYVHPCYTEEEFVSLLNNYAELKPLKAISKYAEGGLVDYLLNLINNGY